MRKRGWLGVGVAALVAIAPGGATADTFTYTGGEQSYTVPAGITGLHVVLVGAAGATSSSGDIILGAAGYGAQLTADVPLPSSTSTIYVEVGGNGGSAAASSYTTSGGYNGGGGGPFGGGGATDIRTVSCGTPSTCAPGGSSDSLASRLAVAGGGGAGGGNADGGSAGPYPDGSGSGGDSAISGTGASTTQAGQPIDQGTVTSYCTATGGTNGSVGEAGGLGIGGTGAYFFIAGTPVSGGGGGGLYGGGGGAQCWGSGATATNYAGSGGAGSSGAPGAQNVAVSTDKTDGAEVIITTPVPTDSTLPTIGGGLTIGDVLTEANGTWSSSLPVSGYAYQWERCDSSGSNCTAISGATGQTYTLRQVDLGSTIRVQETASNFYGPAAAPATSGASGVIGEAPTTASPPTISGTPVAGQVLVDHHAPWTDGPISSYAYQWERCDAMGAACQPIAGATSQAYALSTADVGGTIRVQETATNPYGTSTPSTSAASGVITPPVAPTVTITGAVKPVVGQPATYTAAVSDTQGTAISYRWTVGGAAAGSTVSIKHVFLVAGAATVAVTVTDSAGNMFSSSLSVTATPAPPLGRLNPSMTWTFVTSGRGVAVRVLTIERAPVGARVVAICRGAGCPRQITVPVRCHNTRGRACGKRRTATVALASRFKGRHLSRNATLTVRIVRTGYVGKAYVFSMRRPASPAIGCLAPGSTIPNVGC